MRMKSRFEYKGGGDPQSGLSRRKRIYIQCISYCIWAHRVIRSLTWTYTDIREEKKRSLKKKQTKRKTKKLAGVNGELSYKLGGDGWIRGFGQKGGNRKWTA